jgi:hypothetical protein
MLVRSGMATPVKASPAATGAVDCLATGAFATGATGSGALTTAVGGFGGVTTTTIAVGFGFGLITGFGFGFGLGLGFGGQGFVGGGGGGGGGGTEITQVGGGVYAAGGVLTGGRATVDFGGAGIVAFGAGALLVGAGEEVFGAGAVVVGVGVGVGVGFGGQTPQAGVPAMTTRAPTPASSIVAFGARPNRVELGLVISTPFFSRGGRSIQRAAFPCGSILTRYQHLKAVSTLICPYTQRRTALTAAIRGEGPETRTDDPQAPEALRITRATEG